MENLKIVIAQKEDGGVLRDDATQMRLTIIFQYGGRPYLEKITRDWFWESLDDFKDYEWIELDCSNLTIGQGFNRLAEQVKTEYVMYLQDDWGFFKSPGWMEKCLKILGNHKDIGFIRLRRDNDGQIEEAYLSRRFVDNDMPYYIVGTWDKRGFTLNPFVMRTEDLKKLLPLDENVKHGLAEISGWTKYKALGLSTAKLSVPWGGVCFHLGWGRGVQKQGL